MYDVFLSHNSQDKPAVRELKKLLTGQALSVWYDEDELRPGIPWQALLEAGIKESKSVAVIVGADVLGPWEDEEMQGALQLAVRDKRPVIPVLLPGCPAAPELPMFLCNRTWVDMSLGLTAEGLANLLWGITGVKPSSRSDLRSPKPPATHDRKHREEKNDEPVNDEEIKSLQPPRLTLNQLLPGAWQIQIRSPFQPAIMSQLQLHVFPNGLFRGQLTNPMGITAVEGQWNANSVLNQIEMQGTQTNGVQTIPYVAMVQVTSFDRHRIIGATKAGEQATWQRTS